MFGKIYSFKAENENERNAWMEAILKGMRERNSDDPIIDKSQEKNENDVVQILLKEGNE